MNEYLKIKQQEETEKNNSTSPNNTPSGAHLSTQLLTHVFSYSLNIPSTFTLRHSNSFTKCYLLN